MRETEEGAREQLRALSDVLSVMSGAPNDVQPVLQAVIENAVRLCGATNGSIVLLEDPHLRLVVSAGTFADPAAYHGYWRDRPVPSDRSSLAGRVLLDRASVQLEDSRADPQYQRTPVGTAEGVRTMLGVPLVRQDRILGVVILRRSEVAPFRPDQIRLVEAFSAQAAIAIENVRLFNETKDALERQTATSEILRVISSSPDDVAPVFEAIVRNAARLCGADFAWVIRPIPGGTPVAAFEGDLPAELRAQIAVLRTGAPVGGPRTQNIADIGENAGKWIVARAIGARSVLRVRIGDDERQIGSIVVAQKDVRPFSTRHVEILEGLADQAAIAIENVRLFNETKASLDRETALADVLRTIANSPNDLQPVLDTIARSAATFCRADNVMVALSINDDLQMRSHHGFADLSEAQRRANFWGPARPSERHKRWSSVSGRAYLERRLVHVPDALELDETEFATAVTDARLYGDRALLAAPLLRQGEPIGVILLRRPEPGAFTDEQVNLVKTFADQAVIAIENVRLFNETKEALEQQTAVAEVLASIGRSAFDLESVLRTITERAGALCSADSAQIGRVIGDQIEWVVGYGPRFPVAADGSPLSPSVPVDGATLAALSVRTGQPQYVEDARTRPELPQDGPRTRFAVPLLRDGMALGTLLVFRVEARPFSERERQLVKTFADQAAIAIENVRLFNETKEALQQQTAVAEVLASISRSAFDLPAVLQTITERAMTLCGADSGRILKREGNELVTVTIAGRAAPGGRWPIDGPNLAARVARTREIQYVVDARDHPELPQGGPLTRLFLPILHGDELLGVMGFGHPDVRPFTERQIALVRTFADQAAIAIENVRLFNETKEALERQTAISEVLGTISRSAFDLRAILDTVVQNAVRLCNARSGLIFRRDGDVYRFAAVHGSTPEFAKHFEDDHLPPITPGRGTLTGRVVVSKQPEHVLDLAADPEYAAFGEVNRVEGQRTSLGVPLLHQGEPIGAMSLWRNEVRAFSESEIELVQTFADQAAIAIANVRLFNETKEALGQQRAIAEVLQTISRSVFDLQPVLDTVVENTARLASAEFAMLATSAGPDSYRIAALYGVPVQDPDFAALWADVQRDVPGKTDARSVMGRMLLGRRVIHIEDLETEPGLFQASRILRASRARTVLAVPMLREGRPIGGVIVARLAVRRFSDREIELVQTFADQAAIAIQNTRLFSEIRDQSQQLELASRHKSEFLANMSHELRTPLNAIIGFSDVLLKGMFGELNEKQREYQEDVLSSGRHLLTLINDILDLSKIEAGRVELELGEFSLAEALENGVTMIRERAAKHGIRVQVDVAGVDRIVADERKVKQVVFNLLSNAVKFTPDGGRVDVHAARDNGEVRVAVRDNGIGIDESDRERIFEEFQQASRDPERSREGTGLGLALSKRYVELHGGRIWVDSEVGRGSTFTFALPLAPAGKEG